MSQLSETELDVIVLLGVAAQAKEGLKFDGGSRRNEALEKQFRTSHQNGSALWGAVRRLVDSGMVLMTMHSSRQHPLEEVTLRVTDLAASLAEWMCEQDYAKIISHGKESVAYGRRVVDYVGPMDIVLTESGHAWVRRHERIDGLRVHEPMAIH